MANEIRFGYITGKTLTYGVYQPDGTVRTAAATSLPEIAGTGYYTATNASIVAGDMIIVRESTTEVGQGIWKPEISASGIEAKIDIIDTNVDNILVQQKKVFVNTDESGTTPSLSIVVE